jgi:hypothetical protein
MYLKAQRRRGILFRKEVQKRIDSLLDELLGVVKYQESRDMICHLDDLENLLEGNLRLTFDYVLKNLKKDWDWGCLSGSEKIATRRDVFLYHHLPWEAEMLLRNDNFGFNDVYRIKTLFPVDCSHFDPYYVFSVNRNFSPKTFRENKGLKWDYNFVYYLPNSRFTFQEMKKFDYRDRKEIRQSAKPFRWNDRFKWPALTKTQKFKSVFVYTPDPSIFSYASDLNWETCKKKRKNILGWTLKPYYFSSNRNLTYRIFDDHRHMGWNIFEVTRNPSIGIKDIRNDPLLGANKRAIIGNRGISWRQILDNLDFLELSPYSSKWNVIITQDRYDDNLKMIQIELARPHLAAYLIQEWWRNIAENEKHPIGKKIILDRHTRELLFAPNKYIERLV